MSFFLKKIFFINVSLPKQIIITLLSNSYCIFSKKNLSEQNDATLSLVVP